MHRGPCPRTVTAQARGEEGQVSFRAGPRGDPRRGGLCALSSFLAVCKGVSIHNNIPPTFRGPWEEDVGVFAP